MIVTEIDSLLARTNGLEEFDFPSADSVLSNTVVLARTLFGSDSPHVAELGYVLFRPNDGIYNTGHYMNRVVWNEGIERLRRVLSAMAYELKVVKTQVSLSSPEKITLKWLFDHFPVKWWFLAGGILLSATGLGLTLCKNDAITHFINLASNSPK